MKSTLLQQERQATKLFLFLFFLINFGYDGFYHLIYPLFQKNEFLHFQHVGLYVISYLIQFVLLFISLVLYRKNRPAPIKYLFFIGYSLTSMIIDLVIYSGSSVEYKSGNVVEVFTVLFSPIFINPRFCWVVTIGTFVKYSILGFTLNAPIVMLPLAVVSFLSIVVFILLGRFKGYLKALDQSYGIRLENIVKSVVATLELKDPYTRGHSERVAHYAAILAEKTGEYDVGELQLFYQACLLHDIGKVNIPDHILAKPGSLSNEEYEIIKKHTTVGAQTIKEIEGLENCQDVVLYHHERWDGKGYPQQLKASEIPFTARIVSIADAFDAMTTLRSYRPALPSEEAYHRIVTGAGTQFDPQLVELFKGIFPAWQQFLNQTQWKEIKDPELKASTS